MFPILLRLDCVRKPKNGQSYGLTPLTFDGLTPLTLLRSCSVVNNLTRRAGLSPAFQPTSLAQRLTPSTFMVCSHTNHL